ncbi:MAG: sigma-54-dependent transcriptional regulator [Bacteroidota bacterium]
MIASHSIIDTHNALLSDIEKSSKSLLMQDIFYKVLRLANIDTNVFIVGEIGSGKKRFAEIIHANSRRAQKPFHTFYCVDINESEYKNAFWGHLTFDENRLILKYEALDKAHGGVLYLDQFSELSPSMMLNITESFQKGVKQVFRFETASIPRLILSVNLESYHNLLHTPVWKKLLNKLDPVVIMLPPLRERKEDIPLLIDHFLKELKEKSTDYKNVNISAQALCECFNYSWPGNIRQLKNAILQGAILSLGQTIETKHLPFTMNWNLPYKVDRK